MAGCRRGQGLRRPGRPGPDRIGDLLRRGAHPPAARGPAGGRGAGRSPVDDPRRGRQRPLGARHRARSRRADVLFRRPARGQAGPDHRRGALREDRGRGLGGWRAGRAAAHGTVRRGPAPAAALQQVPRQAEDLRILPGRRRARSRDAHRRPLPRPRGGAVSRRVRQHPDQAGREHGPGAVQEPRLRSARSRAAGGVGALGAVDHARSGLHRGSPAAGAQLGLRRADPARVRPGSRQALLDACAQPRVPGEGPALPLARAGDGVGAEHRLPARRLRLA